MSKGKLIVLEGLDGSGKAWFDDVVIEEIESDDPKLVVNPALTFESGEITNNGNATSNGMRMWMISDLSILITAMLFAIRLFRKS